MPAIQHPVFSTPSDPQISLWRYMDFTKYVSMLENSGLYLSRSDQMGDPFEGSTTRATHDSWAITLLKAKVPLNIVSAGAKHNAQVSGRTRRRMYLNCWHANDAESAAMWRLYSKSNEAVAIKTTFDKLHNALNGTEENPIYMGAVKYIDYDKAVIPAGNIFWPYIHKRKSYEHEREIRVLYFLAPTREEVESKTISPWDVETPNGIWSPIDLASVVDTVFVSPDCDSWLRELVQKVSGRYGLKFEVAQSKLNAEPIF